jgi:putative iron-dependent peroxidase
MSSQPGILAAPPPVGLSLTYRLAPEADARAALGRLRDEIDPRTAVAGIGEPFVRALGAGAGVAGLRGFPALSGAGIAVPSTQQALWLFLRGEDRGQLFDQRRRLMDRLAPDLVLADEVETFVYAGGRDLTGYEDGTENPKDAAAVEAALVKGGAHLAGGSFVAVQRWRHDLARFRSFGVERQDHTIGRRHSDNEEIGDAPPSAHVKRTAQESFDPPAFMVRRSMPWVTGSAQGLEFIAYGASLDLYERVLRRMLGLEDGVVDAMFSFTRPVTGGYYWCPPVAGTRLDLAALGL